MSSGGNSKIEIRNPKSLKTGAESLIKCLIFQANLLRELRLCYSIGKRGRFQLRTKAFASGCRSRYASTACRHYGRTEYPSGQADRVDWSAPGVRYPDSLAQNITAALLPRPGQRSPGR